jgi:hypothetical protein
MKKLFAFILFITISFSVSGYDVDREELEKNKKDVEFINFTGTHEKIDTRKEIYSIGEALGMQLDGKQNVSLSGKYRILHLVDPTEPEKLGADIFILEKSAGVDHIRNLRLILSGYLKSAYGYSEEDSSLIAEFVTYYNAVFRGNTAYFETKYNNMVLVNIAADNAGIDVHYKNWPGKTRMIIPLKNGRNGGTAGPSPKELSEEKVIEDLRKNPDKGIPPRKEMVELREKELDKELESASEKEEKIEKKQEEVSEEIEKINEKIAAAEESRGKGEISDKEFEEEKSTLDEKKDELAEEEETLSDEIEKVKEEIAIIEKEKDEVAQEREIIASDTNELLESGDAAADSSSLTGTMRKPEDTFFIRVLEDSSGKYGELVLLDNETGKIEKTSSLKKTGIRGFLIEKTPLFSTVLITASDNGNDFFLIRAETDTLAVTAKSMEKIYRDTVIIIIDGAVYAVVENGGDYKIGRFSNDLSSAVLSEESVLEDTFIIHDPDNGRIFFQNSEGEIIAADSSDLTKFKGE